MRKLFKGLVGIVVEVYEGIDCGIGWALVFREPSRIEKVLFRARREQSQR